MEGYCSTGQSPQWAVVPVEEKEKEEEEEEEGGGEEEEEEEEEEEKRRFFSKIFRENPSFVKNLTRITDTLHQNLRTFTTVYH
jgi:TATA-binding protein-associated factor Taf7